MKLRHEATPSLSEFEHRIQKGLNVPRTSTRRMFQNPILVFNDKKSQIIQLIVLYHILSTSEKQTNMFSFVKQDLPHLLCQLPVQVPSSAPVLVRVPVPGHFPSLALDPHLKKKPRSYAVCKLEQSHTSISTKQTALMHRFILLVDLSSSGQSPCLLLSPLAIVDLAQILEDSHQKEGEHYMNPQLLQKVSVVI